MKNSMIVAMEENYFLEERKNGINFYSPYFRTILRNYNVLERDNYVCLQKVVVFGSFNHFVVDKMLRVFSFLIKYNSIIISNEYFSVALFSNSITSHPCRCDRYFSPRC